MTIPDPAEAPTAYSIMAHAYAALEVWIAANDPDGEMDLLDQIKAYAAAATVARKMEGKADGQ